MESVTSRVSLFLFFLITSSSGSFENCDYYQKMELEQTYYVYSSNYPQQYPPGMSCRFYANSPPGSNIELVCENLTIPPSNKCYLDRLSISKTGRHDLKDAVNYCGSGSIEIRSELNKINIVAVSASYSPGGSFLCKIRAVPEERNCDCGWKNQQRIVGGSETGINEYPMMAGIVDGPRKELFCGATIISQRFAVTAAHCLVAKSTYKIALLVGDHDISTGNDTDSSKLYVIDKVFVHPDYNTETFVNDIALVRTEKKIQFTRKIGPACLPILNKKETFTGESVVALGWGSLRFGETTSDKLMKVSLDVVSNGECKRTYGSKLTNGQICTYKGKRDACQNDSGGPLLWVDHNTGRLKLLGIVSYGIQCATKNPSVNTRVTSYIDWITSKTDESYCMV